LDPLAPCPVCGCLGTTGLLTAPPRPPDGGTLPTRHRGAVPATDTDLQLPPLPSAGPQVPGYEVLDVLGKGGMGVVYRARQVGLKTLRPGDAAADELARSRTEGEAIARLSHPHIVQAHEVGQHDGRPFFSLEFCPGGSLARRLAGTPLPPAEAARLVET